VWCDDARVRYDLRALNRAANQALGGRWVEVHDAANHAKFGPRAQRTIPSEVLAVPARRHEQWRCFAATRATNWSAPGRHHRWTRWSRRLSTESLSPLPGPHDGTFSSL
jgi:hypothetical protein